MDNDLCFHLLNECLSSDNLERYRMINAVSHDSTLTKWIEPRFKTSLQTDKIVLTYRNLISAGQFQKATDFMLNEIYEHSRVLAEAFENTLDDPTGMSCLFDELMRQNILSEEERNRLNVLQMALDGIDVEVHEYGKNLKVEEINYLSEFLGTIRGLL
jgi:hypothetical protein